MHRPKAITESQHEHQRVVFTYNTAISTAAATFNTHPYGRELMPAGTQQLNVMIHTRLIGSHYNYRALTQDVFANGWKLLSKRPRKDPLGKCSELSVLFSFFQSITARGKQPGPAM